MPLTGLPADVTCAIQGIVSFSEFLSFNVSGDRRSGVTTIVLHFGPDQTNAGEYPNVYSPPQARRKAPCPQRRDYMRWNQRYGQTFYSKSTRPFQTPRNSTPVKQPSPFSIDPPLPVDSGVEESRSSQLLCSTETTTKGNNSNTPTTLSPVKSKTCNDSVMCTSDSSSPCDVSDTSSQTTICDSFNDTPSEIHETHNIEDDLTTNDDNTQDSSPDTWELSDENIQSVAQSRPQYCETLMELSKFIYYTLKQDRDSLSQVCGGGSKPNLKRVTLDPSDSNTIIAETDQLVFVFNDSDRLLHYYFMKKHTTTPQESQLIHYLSTQAPCKDPETIEDMQKIANNLCTAVAKIIQSV